MAICESFELTMYVSKGILVFGFSFADIGILWVYMCI